MMHQNPLFKPHEKMKAEKKAKKRREEIINEKAIARKEILEADPQDRSMEGWSKIILGENSKEKKPLSDGK